MSRRRKKDLLNSASPPPRNEKLSVKVSKKEKRLLTNRAGKLGITVSSLVRKGVRLALNHVGELTAENAHDSRSAQKHSGIDNEIKVTAFFRGD